MRYLIPFISILLIPFTTHAQYSDSVHHFAGLTAMGNINKTNNNTTYLFNNGLSFGIKKKAYSLSSSSSWIYGQVQQTTTNNDFSSTLNMDLYKVVPVVYLWGLGSYNTSISLKINDQFQAGGGIAYNIIDSKNARINISDGLLYEHSDIYLADTIRDVYSTVRNSFRFLFRFNINGIFSIGSTSFIQNSFTLRSDYIIRSNLNMDIKLNKWLSFVTGVTYNRFNRTGKENTIFNYGLTAQRYF